MTPPCEAMIPVLSMPTDPTITIIIPCYRQACYLPGAVESALGQSYPAVEVIVVNDGSDDDTEEVARRYLGRIRYVAKKNGGLSSARNAGIAQARGKYLHFLDADDLLHPEAIDWLVQAIDGREDRIAVMGHQDFTDRPDPGRGKSYYPADRLPKTGNLLFSNVGPPHTFLSCRATVSRLGGFDEGLRSCEDWDLWSRMVLDGAQIVVVPHIGAYYRQHALSMSRNLARMAHTRCIVLRRTLGRIRKDPGVLAARGMTVPQATAALESLLAQELLDSAYYSREDGKYGNALLYYLKGLTRRESVLGALCGVGKLLPHWCLRRVGLPQARLSSRATPHASDDRSRRVPATPTDL
jgi:glycosyltransferase involved in cell wall biosynthesis